MISSVNALLESARRSSSRTPTATADSSSSSSTDDDYLDDLLDADAYAEQLVASRACSRARYVSRPASVWLRSDSDLDSAPHLEPSRPVAKVNPDAVLTNCGHDNPEGHNFCGQCGSALTAPSRSSPRRRRLMRRPTVTRPSLIPAMTGDRDGETLTAEDGAGQRYTRKGSALLIVQRSSNAGSRFLLNTDLVTAGGPSESPTSSSTTSPSPDGTPRRSPGALTAPG